MKFRSRYIDIDSTKIHLVECGKGKPLVLIHGLTSSWEVYIPIASMLSKYYRVFIPDLPGYGDSGRLPRYSPQIMAKYLHKLMVKLKIQPFAIIGFSASGIVAAEFAKTFPESTQAIVIMGPVLKSKHRGVHIAKYLLKSTGYVPFGRRALKKIVDTDFTSYFFAKHFNMYRFNKELIDTYGRNGKKKMTQDAYVDMGISAVEYNFDHTLSTTQKPTLLLYGREDKMSSHEYAREHVIPQNSFLTLSVIPEAGHIVSLEKPIESASAIMSFLSSAFRD